MSVTSFQPCRLYLSSCKAPGPISHSGNACRNDTALGTSLKANRRLSAPNELDPFKSQRRELRVPAVPFLAHKSGQVMSRLSPLHGSLLYSGQAHLPGGGSRPWPPFGLIFLPGTQQSCDFGDKNEPGCAFSPLGSLSTPNTFPFLPGSLISGSLPVGHEDLHALPGALEACLALYIFLGQRIPHPLAPHGESLIQRC